MTADHDHSTRCPQHDDPSAVCICEQLENAMIEKASFTSPADLLRAARAKGLLQGAAVFDYGGQTATP